MARIGAMISVVRKALDLAGSTATKLPSLILLSVVIAAFLCLSLVEMSGDSCTYDEGAHLAAGYGYAALQDYRLNPEHPPLAKILAAFPLLGQSFQFPMGEDWVKADQYPLGFRFLYQSGNDSDRLLMWARLPTLLWGVVLLVAIYALSMELFGRPAALLSLLLAAFCPTILGHSHLVTTDVIVAVFVLLILVAFRNYVRNSGWRWAIYTGLLLGGALASKYSALMLVPLLIAWATISTIKRHMDRQQSDGGEPPQQNRPGPLVRMAQGTGIMLLAITVLWGVYAFRYAPTLDDSFSFSWDDRRLKRDVVGRCILLARDRQLLPESYLAGFWNVVSHSRAGHRAYALGEYSSVGWWWYFPFAFAVKAPLPTLILVGWGLWASVRCFRAGLHQGLFLVPPLVLYGFAVLKSNINIGERHLLPLYPLLFVLAGSILVAGIQGSGPIKRRYLAGILVALSVGDCLLSAPHFLSYFNLPARLVRKDRLLADSSLDWGQDLRRLKRYMEEQGIGSVKLSYYGVASPRQAGLTHQALPGVAEYLRHEPEWARVDDWSPGDVVAVSARNYRGVILKDRHYYLRRFGDLKPIARVGDSILVFRIPADTP